MKWPLVKLQELVEINIGRTPSRDNSDYWGEGLPWLSIRDMNQGKTLNKTAEQITALAVQEAKCKIAKKGTVLFSFKLSIGKVGIAHVDMFHNEAIAAMPIKLGVELCTEYLYFALMQIDSTKSTDRAVMGATLNKKKMAELKIPLPPLETQKQIATVLEKADQLRKDCQQMEQELNSLAQSVFIDMFGDVTEMEDLSNHLEFITSGSRGWAKYYSNSGRRFIRSLDVQMNHIGEVDIAYVQPPSGKETERTKVQSGDVLLTITGSRIGRVSWVPQDFGDAHISQHVALLRLKDLLLPEFLSYFMSLKGYGQRQIAKSQYGQTKPGLKLDHIKAFSIPKITLEKQQEFVDYMYKLTLVISDNKKQLKETGLNFNALMQKAFKGELNL